MTDAEEFADRLESALDAAVIGGADLGSVKAELESATDRVERAQEMRGDA